MRAPVQILFSFTLGITMLPACIQAQETEKSVTTAVSRKVSKSATTEPHSTPKAVNGTALNGSENVARRARQVLEDPLSGVIVNRTVTVQGHDFYRYFSAWWRDTDTEGNYSISIHERPSARWGSEVWVQYRRERVFHMFLPPARSRTKEISRQAVDIAWDNITRNELQRAIFQSEDLGPEEM